MQRCLRIPHEYTIWASLICDLAFYLVEREGRFERTHRARSVNAAGLGSGLLAYPIVVGLALNVFYPFFEYANVSKALLLNRGLPCHTVSTVSSIEASQGNMIFRMQLVLKAIVTNVPAHSVLELKVESK